MNEKINAKKAEVDTTKKQNVLKQGDFTATTSSGGANANMVLTLTDNALDLMINNPPRQVVLVCQLLKNLGGSATIGQLNGYILQSMNDTNCSYWVDKKSEKYVQDIYPVMSTYLDKMTGNKEWTAKKGKFTLVSIS
jgi:hypothetical protein|tara:strand:+ start:836 stop:1246 length:411 start_codon:yes stop_codon:yes gene_type:complete